MPPPKRLCMKPADIESKNRTHHPTQLAQSQASLFLRLPAELHLEIISHYPILGVPAFVSSHATFLSVEYGYRSQVLHALSKTCRLLRNFYLPLAWEVFDACISYLPSGAWYRELGERLLLRSRFLMANPGLAKHVRVVNVSLTRYQTETVLTQFARCLSSLPNVQTLQIIHAHTQMTTALQSAFEKLRLPTIHTIVLPTWGHEILRTCINVRAVYCTGGDGSQLVTAMAKFCKKVEIASGFGKANVIKRIVKAAPHMHTISLNDFVPSAIQLLAKCNKLEMIELQTMGVTPGNIHYPGFQDCLSVAKGILKTNKRGKQILRIRYRIFKQGLELVENIYVA